DGGQRGPVDSAEALQHGVVDPPARGHVLPVDGVSVDHHRAPGGQHRRHGRLTRSDAAGETDDEHVAGSYSAAGSASGSAAAAASGSAAAAASGSAAAGSGSSSAAASDSAGAA